MNFFIQKACCVWGETKNKRKVAYEDSWYLRSLKEKVLECPSLSRHVDADVCVVGGGLAGVTAALGLAERGKKVVLVEKNLVGWGASGRNGGFALPGYQIDNYEVMEKCGEEKARQFYAETVKALHLLRKRIDDYGIECDVHDGGDIEVSCFADTEEEYKELMEYSNKKMGTNLHFWDTEKTRSIIKTDFFHHGVYTDDGFSVNPLGMTIGLGRAAISRGAKIFEKTEVTKWRSVANFTKGDPSIVSRKFVVETQGADGEKGTVGADNIVLATNYTDNALNTKYFLGTIPLYTYILVTKPLPALQEEKGGEEKEVEGELGKFITRNMTICDDREALAYFRTLPGGRLLFGGLAEAYPIKDEEEVTKRLMEDLYRVFPNLPEVEKEVVWGGRINLNKSFMPLIGQVEEGVWYCTGFAGHGVVATTVGGEVIASGIASGDERWKLFQEHYPLTYSGWPFHKIAAMCVFKFNSFQDEYYMWKQDSLNKIKSCYKGWF